MFRSCIGSCCRCVWQWGMACKMAMWKMMIKHQIWRTKSHKSPWNHHENHKFFIKSPFSYGFLMFFPQPPLSHHESQVSLLSFAASSQRPIRQHASKHRNTFGGSVECQSTFQQKHPGSVWHTWGALSTRKKCDIQQNLLFEDLGWERLEWLLWIMMDVLLWRN